MNTLTSESYLPAAQSVIRLLQRQTPDEADRVTPYITRLFAALQDGHSFIWLNDEDVQLLQTAKHTVGSSGHTPLILLGRRLFIGRVWQLERDLAAEIGRLAQAQVSEIDFLQIAQDLENWFDQEGSEGQKRAAALALLQPFMLITGGPGTGKTTTVAKLLSLICNNETDLPRIALAAPTGKAAAHMARALHRALDGFDVPERIRQHLLQLEGRTVHRLLKLRPPQMKAAFNRENPLPLDVLVVDEASMLDTALLLQLLQALAQGCRVILLGDEFQLPSVGAGAVLAALSQETVLDKATAERLSQILPKHSFQTASEAKPLAQNIAKLTHSHRFGADSGIGCLARAVVSGKPEEALQQFAKFPEELAMQQAGTRKQAELLFEKHQKYWQAVEQNDIALIFGHVADIVVLAAWRNDADNFNQEYHRCLIRHGKVQADTPWYVGQIIMIIRNDPVLDVFNGDIGVVLPDEEASGGLSAYFPAAEGFKKLALSRLPAFEPAFAMTVHKSQGSEYQEVWLIPPTVPQDAESISGLNRALLYTGITRARKQFTYWGNESSFSEAVSTDKPRRSALAWLLSQ